MTYILGKPFDMRIAEGEVEGYSYVVKFGHNPDIDSGSVPETVWDNSNLYVKPTQSRTHDIVSTSTKDVGALVSSGIATGGSVTTLVDSGASFVVDGVAAGDTVINDTTMEHSVVVSVTATTITTENTRHGGNLGDDLAGSGSGGSYRVVTPSNSGASILHIKQGLDEDLEPLEEFVILNGTTNVPTVNEYFRIPRMHIDGSLNLSTNLGDVTATAQIDATVTSFIGVGEGQTAQAFFTVPAGKTAWLERWWSDLNRDGSASGSMVDLEFWVTPHALSGGSGSRLGGVMALNLNGTSALEREYGFMGPKFEHETDVEVRVVWSKNNDMKVSAGFTLRLKDN